MKTTLSNQQTVNRKHGVRYTASFPIDLPAERIDLYQWVTEMTEQDYASYSKAHQAMGSHFKDGVFYTVNVENIGNETIIQHYELKYHTPSHVQFYSERSKAYIWRWLPAVVGVPWEMQIRPISANTSAIVCLIGVDFPNAWLRIGSWFNGLNGYFLRKHLRKEGFAFAKDITSKFSN
ncbi:hypothetical protein [Mucilaginibacter sp. 22184]|uniref:hypothetical protein n=1 Tax=Mucilaginibacter sp. 22184 TaxID=3453887 RepID=UPI003F85F888